ncbi:MAG: nucleotidyltransferase [Eubacterium sp.]|nr:nucleotidyltransferase [Eubacterium sp.]
MENKRVLGIVAEYNPMHNGHIYQLLKCKEESMSDCVVAVVSGNFTQRGEPALLDKWTRTEMAILSGVDLVIELPFYYACNSAEYFASGAVDILNSMGIITHLGFGSECGDIEQLKKTAMILVEESHEFKENLKKYLDEGHSFPKARQLAAGEYGTILNEPNNILAIEYLKKLTKESSDIIPITVKREKTAYHDENINENIASGKGIRKFLRENDNSISLDQVMNSQAAKVLEDAKEFFVFSDSEKYFALLKSCILRSDKEHLKKIFSITEGLENKIIKEIRNCNSLDQFIESLKSKRYTRTMLQRICTHILLDMKKEQVQDKYIRVLGFNQKGAALLKRMKKEETCKYPVITNINKIEDVDLSLDIRANDIYNMISGRDTYNRSDFVVQPVRIMK